MKEQAKHYEIAHELVEGVRLAEVPLDPDDRLSIAHIHALLALVAQLHEIREGLSENKK